MSELHGFLDEARALLPAAVTLRRRIHAKPELGLDLPLTTAAVLDELRGLDVAIARGSSTSGLIVTLTGTGPRAQIGRTILLRGDMDALPMPEDTGLDYASEFPGRMHACGHDSHTAMLVQAVHLLHRHKDELAGTVKFMFQPGEEGHGGARLMIADGLLDADPKPDAAFALHIWPNSKTGAIMGKPGPMLASADTWTIIVKGRGGHASMPHDAIDPIPVAFEIGLALQALVTRRIDVFDPVVLTCAKVTAGTTNNVIPESVEMVGTLRAISEAARDRAHAGIRRVAANIGAAHLCEAEVSIQRGYPVTVNDPAFVDFARTVATELLGADAYVDWPAPLMGAEDFSYVLQRIPGCMLALGAMPDGYDGHDHVAPCHSNRMIMNEGAMAVGIAMHASIAHRFLAPAR
ncbi:MAG TPA: M20 family metallopeptidase [Stellaceae bacterium]|jgi:amidohydrolase|nr:M20 family metallopeptidase [Stellaceae bacterium]